MKTWVKTFVALVVGVGIGIMLGRGCRNTQQAGSKDAGNASASEAQTQTWTCSMHPQIRQPKPGRCPICGMELTPVASDASSQSDSPRQITLSASAQKLAEIALAPVERRAVAVKVRMVGKVTFDETRVAMIAPRVPGRIDRLYANFTGVSVRPGDHLADLYSPDLVSAQQELLQALKLSRDRPESVLMLDATRERLRLWGLTAAQIAEIEHSGQVRDHVTFYSPIGGIVTTKEVREGQYVEAGARLFTVADLSQVWVQLDAYETDLTWLRYAQEVAFQAEAYPAMPFTGTIAFIDPLLDPATRTVKVRVNVANDAGRLKPGMFVRAEVSAKVTKKGAVARPDLQGKWISPMHPEIIKDTPGTCDVCDMPLVRAEELGYAAPDDTADDVPLVIPATAPLITGKRAVVYVALPDTVGLFEGREIVLGARAQEYYLVREGLEAGERVVVNGAFKLDSALQIQGKPSMMTSETVADPAPQTPVLTAPQAFRKQLAGVFTQVLNIGEALADDNLAAAATAATATKHALDAVDMALLTQDAHVHWMASLNAINLSLTQMQQTQKSEAFRLAFSSFSSEMIRVAKIFAPLHSKPLYIIHCPMAFNDRGADWLQQSPKVRNPYFGESMLGCGDVTETIPAEEGHTHE